MNWNLIIQRSLLRELGISTRVSYFEHFTVFEDTSTRTNIMYCNGSEDGFVKLNELILKTKIKALNVI